MLVLVPVDRVLVLVLVQVDRVLVQSAACRRKSEKLLGTVGRAMGEHEDGGVRVSDGDN